MSADSRKQEQAGVVYCQECGVSSEPSWHDWRAYRADVPSEDDVPLVVFCCPSCAEREFGVRTRTSTGPAGL